MSRETVRLLKAKIRQLKKRRGVRPRLVVLYPGEICPPQDDPVIVLRIVYDDLWEQGDLPCPQKIEVELPEPRPRVELPERKPEPRPRVESEPQPVKPNPMGNRLRKFFQGD